MPLNGVCHGFGADIWSLSRWFLQWKAVAILTSYLSDSVGVDSAQTIMYVVWFAAFNQNTLIRMIRELASNSPTIDLT